MKIKKRTIIISIAIAALLLASFAFIHFYPVKKESKPEQVQPADKKIGGYVDRQGYLHYPINRGEINFSKFNYSEDDKTLTSKIVFESRRGNIYSLLVIPKKVKSPQIPGVVLLPGAGVSKESELSTAKEIANMGFAVLTLDQRGVGESKMPVPNLEQDFNLFANGIEPYSHLVVYDALKASDLLRSAPFVDSTKIIMAGESLGGRITIIASAIDGNIKGALAISSSGYEYKTNDTLSTLFLDSINPDHYVQLISPRKLAMIHNVNDKTVKYESGLRTFEKANDPKKFWTINSTTCNHGYCEVMKDQVRQALEYLVS